MYVVAKHVSVIVQSPEIDADHGVFWEMYAVESDASLWHAPLKDETRCRVDSHGFVDHSRPLQLVLTMTAPKLKGEVGGQLRGGGLSADLQVWELDRLGIRDGI